jgi:hypothetical protein
VSTRCGKSREFQARAVEELAMLPEGSVVAEMLSDYAEMRDQVPATCGAGQIA